MGVFACILVYAWYRDGADRCDDHSEAQRIKRRKWWQRRVAAGLILCFCAVAAEARELRIAYFHSELSRDGPGLLLRDILSGNDPQLEAFNTVISETTPDVLVLADVDFDLRGVVASELAKLTGFPHAHALLPNRGMATGEDLDGDGRYGTPNDAQGFGHFAGQGGMIVLSRHPIGTDIQDFSGLRWQDLPGNIAPAGTHPIQKLSTTGHWVVPIEIAGNDPLHLMIWHATPPVFDGPEDRNGRRNHDETAFWLRYLEGSFGAVPANFILAGTANLDPVDGEGRAEALTSLLHHPLLIDPVPKSIGGALAAAREAGANGHHRGDPGLDTANWRDTPSPGNLRVDYILPSNNIGISDAGVFWPMPENPLFDAVQEASRHRLIWVDIEF